MVLDQRFAGRKEAGRLLAEKLQAYSGRKDVIVLALPRGGVPVGYEIAHTLHVPLDVLIVRKLGVPFQPELAMGAIASGGVRVLNSDLIRELGIDATTIEEATHFARRELERREIAYRGNRPAANLHDKTVLLVDDGLATGATMHAAMKAVQQLGAARVVIVTPVAPPEVAREFQSQADEFCCLSTPSPFYAIGAWYEDFSQVDDDHVRNLLNPKASPTAAKSQTASAAIE
jgi:putative phosphoribosyl transferase